MIAKSWSEPTPNFVNCALKNKLMWNANKNTIIFIHGNEFENILGNLSAIFVASIY